MDSDQSMGAGNTKSNKADSRPVNPERVSGDAKGNSPDVFSAPKTEPAVLPPSFPSLLSFHFLSLNNYSIYQLFFMSACIDRNLPPYFIPLVQFANLCQNTPSFSFLFMSLPFPHFSFFTTVEILSVLLSFYTISIVSVQSSTCTLSSLPSLTEINF